MTEVWFRNPHAYVKELAEVGGPHLIAWDRGILVKKHIDPVQHAKLYFGEQDDFRLLAIGPQGSAELDKDHTLENPIAVYPTWEFGEDFNILEEMVSSPIGQDADACLADVPKDQRPVAGQEHRVVLVDLPNAHLSANRPFYRHLKELQEEYPECIFHIHGSYSYRVMFGMGFGAADVEPRTSAANGRVFLPNGKELAYARTVGQMYWINLLGMSITDLKVPRERCIFNIKSALWAGEHFTDDTKQASRATGDSVDYMSPHTPVPATTHSWKTDPSRQPQEGDMVTCDSCSLNDTCKYARDGAVCSVKGSETNVLGKMFQTRDSGQIIGAIGALMEASSERLQRGMESEKEFGELDPEVTKLMNQMIGNAMKLAKLVDPSLTKPLVQINNGQGVQGQSQKEITRNIVQMLNATGVKTEDITAEMIENAFRVMAGPNAAVAGPPQIVQGGVESERAS